MSYWDNTGGASSIDLGTCTGATATGTLTWYYPYDNCQDTTYNYQYHYYTDPKLIELIKEVLALLKQVLKEKRKKR